MSRRAVLVSRTLAALAFAALAVPAPAAAPANSFNIVSSAGKTVGNAAYTITKDKNGYHLVAKFQYHFGSAVQADTNTGDAHMGSMVAYNEGQFSEDLKVSEEGSFLSGYVQNSTNQLMSSFVPNKAGTILTVNQLQGGASQAHDVTLPKPIFLVVPDFDPATLQLFLTTALAHPHDDKTYLFVVPAGSNPRGRDQPAYVVLQLAPDTPSGTLDGKPVQLMHYLLGYHTGKPADLYIDNDGTLMQADITPLGVSYIRAKFSLTAAPAK
jgi:hypothetical protein